MSNDNDQLGGGEDRVDEIARGAGAALRRPAPADGMARVRSSQHRRRTARAVAGVSVVVVMVVGLFLVIGRGADDATVVTDSGPDTVSPNTVTTSPDTVTTSPQVVPSPTDEPATEDTGSAPTTTTNTSEPPATAPSNVTGWQPATERFPALAFIACCGSDWEGEPSPAVPTDPAAPLPAGIYNVRGVADRADGFVDGLLTLEVRPYTRCNELGEFECSGFTPYEDTDLGLPTNPAANDRRRARRLRARRGVRIRLRGRPAPQRPASRHRHRSGDVVRRTRLVVRNRRRWTAAQWSRPNSSPTNLVRTRLRGSSIPNARRTRPSRGRPRAARRSSPAPSTGWTPPQHPEPLSSAAAYWITPTARFVVDEQGDSTFYYLYAGFLSRRSAVAIELQRSTTSGRTGSA